MIENNDVQKGFLTLSEQQLQEKVKNATKLDDVLKKEILDTIESINPLRNTLIERWGKIQAQGKEIERLTEALKDLTPVNDGNDRSLKR